MWQNMGSSPLLCHNYQFILLGEQLLYLLLGYWKNNCQKAAQSDFSQALLIYALNKEDSDNSPLQSEQITSNLLPFIFVLLYTLSGLFLFFLQGCL